MTLQKSWVSSANETSSAFPLNNLPYGVFSRTGQKRKLGVAIGDQIVDVLAAVDALPVDEAILADPRGWNGLMELGSAHWAEFRSALTQLLTEDSPVRHELLVPQSDVELHLPFTVAEFTDFYSNRNHATNVGTMFRGPENALPPNWLHIPIGYNGRASSVVVSGTDIQRPWGQLKGQDYDAPVWSPSRRFDIELELGAIVGTASTGPLSVEKAFNNLFGYVLLNDWSARDIQAWEYQPLGPFQAKATATTISPWIVTAAALEPFRCNTPPRDEPLLEHLQDCGPMLYDIDLYVSLNSETIATTNFREMYFSPAQQLAHHTTSGCPMRTGDLLGSGTISGTTANSRGSLLELSWGGKEPLTLRDGSLRSFIEDGDTLGLHGTARGGGFQIGFGDCVGSVVPALAHPFDTG